MRRGIFEDAASLHEKSKRVSYTNKLVLVAMLSGLSAIFQSAGALFPGIGYLISPLATAPIIFCAILSIRLGVLSYLLTILILLFSHPSELVVFPFTTGLLGLAVGAGFLICRTHFTLTIMGCSALALGILTVLYGLKFPLLGPVASTVPKLSAIAGIVVFSAFYSWLWVRAGKILLKRINGIIP